MVRNRDTLCRSHSCSPGTTLWSIWYNTYCRQQYCRTGTTYDEFHITHNVDSSTVELEQPYHQFDITHNAESLPVLQEQRYDTIKKLCLDFHSTVILCIVTHLFTRKTKENGNGFFFSWKYLRFSAPARPCMYNPLQQCYHYKYINMQLLYCNLQTLLINIIQDCYVKYKSAFIFSSDKRTPLFRPTQW